MTTNPDLIRGQKGMQWFQSFKQELKSRNSSFLREIYRGYFPLFSRQCVAWVSFLTADSFMKKTIRDWLNLSQTDRIPYSYLLTGTLCVTMINTLAIMPMDNMKTQLQRENLSALTTRQAVKQVVSKVGISGLFVGWRIRFALYQLSALFTSGLLDKLETSYKKIKQTTAD